MKLDQITNKEIVVDGVNPNDEFYTPRYAIVPLLKYLKPNSKIYCPFDTEASLFVKILKEEGHNVVHSHIFNGHNFFDIKKEKCSSFDYIISNPPYSLKFEVFEKLFEIGVPFAMLVGVVGLFESKKRFDLFKNNQIETMYFDKRVSYFKDYNDPKPKLNPPFSSIYLCSGVLPKQIVFEEINKNNI